MSGDSLEPGTGAGAPNQRKRKAPPPAAAAEDEDEAEAEVEVGVEEEEEEELESVEELEREVAELEREVADLDRCSLEHIRGTATRLSDNAVSNLIALRPPARLEVPVVSETSVVEYDQDLQKLDILKSKVEANIADLPKVLEKVNETVARCEKLSNLDFNVHPVFERKL